MTRRTSRAVGPAARRWLALAVGSGGLLVFFAVALYSWWLAVLLLVLGVAAAPSAVRELRRRRHHHAIAERGPTAADAAWTELLAESLDRGLLCRRVRRCGWLRIGWCGSTIWMLMVGQFAHARW